MKINSITIRILLFPALFCSATDTFAQEQLDETKMVGFACFYEGRETEVVARFGKMLKQNRYASIKRMLRSENTAERFLAVLCLERLSSAGRVAISAEERALIDQNKRSTELLSVCSGCVPQPDIPLQEAFESLMLRTFTAWLDRYIND